MSMNTTEIKELLQKRVAIVNVICDCRASINEISLRSVDTISLSDLRDKIDFEKYPELEYLFCQENLNYLKPYRNELMGLEDKDLGIACRELVVAEIACLLGLDLTGRYCGGICGLTDTRKIEIAKKHLETMGVETKEIVYFKDVLDIRLIWANNTRKFNEIKNITREDKVVFDEAENSLLVVTQSKQTDGSFKPFSYKDNVYDLLYPFIRDLGDDLVISDEILDKDYYDKIEIRQTLSLEEAIKETILSGVGYFEENSFCLNESAIKRVLPYDGDKEDIDTFVSFVANQMRNIYPDFHFIEFLHVFANKVYDVCLGKQVPELEDFFMDIYCADDDGDDYCEYF